MYLMTLTVADYIQSNEWTTVTSEMEIMCKENSWPNLR